MYESKYLLNIEEFLARHPEINDDIKELAKNDIADADFDLFAFIMSYIFM